MTTVMLFLLGLVAGVTSGLLGIGGGVLLVPALVLIARVEIHIAIGVSLAVIVPTALVGVLKHYSLGNVEFATAITVAIGGMLGAYLGASYASSVSEENLKRMFGVLLLVLGFNMIFGWSASIAKAAEKRIEKHQL